MDANVARRFVAAALLVWAVFAFGSIASAQTVDDQSDSPIQSLEACACGCDVFDVATSSMLPNGPGGTVYLNYDYQDQNEDWRGTSRARASLNPDREIRTHFLTMGAQYMFNRSWGVQVEVPYSFRHFETTGGASGDDLVTINWSDIGDMRIEGIYTGFSEDMSSGLTFGAKLPTGDYRHNNAFGDVDRDSELGTGATDALIGGFFRHDLTADPPLTGFLQTEVDVPVLSRDGYRPGWEVDTAAGVTYNGLHLGSAQVSPIAQVIWGYRGSDSGVNAAHPIASGFDRILLAPGLEVHLHPVMVYADVEVPVFEYTRGYQLVAPVMFKVILAYNF